MAIVFLLSNFRTVDFTKDAEKGIQFHKGTWNEALQLASKENKLVFLDIYATWCGPCRKLKANTFSNEEVGTFYNSKFINVSIDGESAEGSELAKKFQIRGYPTLLFVNSKGEIVSGTSGYHNPKEIIELGKEVLASGK